MLTGCCLHRWALQRELPRDWLMTQSSLLQLCIWNPFANTCPCSWLAGIPQWKRFLSHSDAINYPQRWGKKKTTPLPMPWVWILTYGVPLMKMSCKTLENCLLVVDSDWDSGDHLLEDANRSCSSFCTTDKISYFLGCSMVSGHRQLIQTVLVACSTGLGCW